MDFTGTLLNEYNSLPAYWWLWLIVVALVVWVVVFLFFDVDKKRGIPLSSLAACILFILMETIIGRKTGVGRVELVPFWSYSHLELRMEIVLNYLLFMPLGVLLYLCFGEKYGLRVVVAGLLLSVSIEIVQLVFRIGLFEFDDMIGNTVGCLIGAVIGKLIRKKKKKATPEAV